MTKAKPPKPLTEEQIAHALDQLSDGRDGRTSAAESRRRATWSLGLPREMVDILGKDLNRASVRDVYRTVKKRKKPAPALRRRRRRRKKKTQPKA